MITEKTMSDLVGLVEEVLDERAYLLFEDRLESANYSNSDRRAFSAMRLRVRQALPVIRKTPLLMEASRAAFAALNFDSMEFRDKGDAEYADSLDDITAALVEALKACGIECAIPRNELPKASEREFSQ